MSCSTGVVKEATGICFAGITLPGVKVKLPILPGVMVREGFPGVSRGLPGVRVEDIFPGVRVMAGPLLGVKVVMAGLLGVTAQKRCFFRGVFSGGVDLFSAEFPGAFFVGVTSEVLDFLGVFEDLEGLESSVVEVLLFVFAFLGVLDGVTAAVEAAVTL